MDYLVFFFSFIFGAIIGSFLNVVALRFKSGKTLGGRSFCFSCGKTLRSHELIPIFSFLIQGGKCRGCKSPISMQYPIVEAITGVTFGVLAVYASSVFWFMLFAISFSVLIVIAIYDVKHKIIPDSLAVIFGFLGFVSMIVSNHGNLTTSEGLLAMLAGPILFLPFFFLWLVSRGTWMGLGDAKLSIGIGWLLGLASGLSAIIIGVWIGALWSLLAMLFDNMSNKKKALNMKSEIPLAPFLILGTFISLIFQTDVFNLSSWIDILLK